MNPLDSVSWSLYFLSAFLRYVWSMRKWMLFFIVVFGFMAEAQTKFDYLSCQKVLTERIAAIQLKIWNGVVDGKLIPYQTAAMDSILSIAQVRERCAGIDSIKQREQSELFNANKKRNETQEKFDSLDEYEDSWFGDSQFDNSYGNDSNWISHMDLVDSTNWARERIRDDERMKRYNLKEPSVRFDFDSTRDLTGLSFGFEYSIDSENISSSYGLTSIGLVSNVSAEFGIVLDNQLLFYVDYSALKSILTNEENTLLNALVLQRSSLGNFLPSYMDLYRQDIENNVEAMDYFRFTKERNLLLAQDEIAVLAAYNALTFNRLGREFTDMSSKIDLSKYFFRDSNLQIPYTKMWSELSEETIIEIPKQEDEDFQDYFGPTGVWGPFSFDWLKEPWIESKPNGNYLIHYDVEDKSGDSEKEEMAELRKIYFSYSSIKYLLQPHDRVVLEALLREIAK